MTQTTAAAAQAGTTKWVYLFEEAPANNRDLLGGKGAGLAAMTQAGLPVPPGFTITTAACNAYYASGRRLPPGLWEQVLAALKTLEQKTGKRFGDPANPLLVSVRSGAKFSMPGMMDTVLNLGLNDQTVEGLARLTNNERFAWDAYRRFVQMFGRIVLGIPGERFEQVFEEYKAKVGAKQDTDLDAKALREITAEFKKIVAEETGKPFPNDPYEQLRLAISAVFNSWMGKRAVDYRNFNKIPHDLCTAVNVQMMVFGNMGFDSGTGVAFTRNPSTGEKQLYGEFLPNAQGEDVVAGIRTPLPIAKMAELWPDVYRQLETIARRLEQTYRDMQDLEFTVERGKLYMLQTRSGKRTAAAAFKIARDMVHEGLITKEEALQRVDASQIVQLLLPRFDPEARARAEREGRLLARGLAASPGAAVGRAVFDADRAVELAEKGEPVILVRPETSPDDFHGMARAQGILTSRGGNTSHAAVVARGMGKPCIVGAEAIRIDLATRKLVVDGREVREGEWLSIDGSRGEVFLGQIPTVEPKFEEQADLREVLSWADEVRRLGVWANADTPEEAARAREFGAGGIGLCRTEHMFREEGRPPYVQQMILAAPEYAAAKARVQALKNERERRLAQAASAEELTRLDAQIAAEEQALKTSPVGQRYLGALAKLGEFQRGDFYGILKVMHDLPVIIRLIDPPLHEFLPRLEDLLVQVTEMRMRGERGPALEEKERLLQAVEKMHEQNPMLGLRGCRLGILYPEITQMQVRAILEAATQLAREGVRTLPEIMIPLVGHVNELRTVRAELEQVARQVLAESGTSVEYKFGTMIEVPRAAITADQIAQDAEFFSFGTNDLTQMVFAFSRDDAEAKFLGYYIEHKILPVNPFQTLDRDGVGAVMRIGVEKGRATRPDLEVGICGEHGGDPDSIAFCHELGLNYVSASPFRVPIARLAAAQAALASKKATKDV